MGGCASKPKAADDFPEAPSTTTDTEQLVAPAQEESSKDGGDHNQAEESLVDLSEPDQKTGAAAGDDEHEPVFAETAKPTEEDAKAPAKNADEEEKVEATNDFSAVPAMEGKADKSDAATAPSTEGDDDDAPFVTL